MTQHTTPVRDDDSIATASLWMVGLAILLGWIPIVGPAIAGYVGGRKAGSPGRGVIAGIIPAVVLGAIIAIVLALFDLPLIGTLTGIALAIAVVVDAVPLLIAAAVGGWVDTAETGPPS